MTPLGIKFAEGKRDLGGSEIPAWALQHYCAESNPMCVCVCFLRISGYAFWLFCRYLFGPKHDTGLVKLLFKYSSRITQ